MILLILLQNKDNSQSLKKNYDIEQESRSKRSDAIVLK